VIEIDMQVAATDPTVAYLQQHFSMPRSGIFHLFHRHSAGFTRLSAKCFHVASRTDWPVTMKISRIVATAILGLELLTSKDSN
jgi:hypothetical protein